MERAKRAAVWISSGFALLLFCTLLILLLAPSVAAVFPGRVTEFNTLLAVLVGALGPAAFTYAMYQPEKNRLLPHTSWNAWLSVIALTALGTNQFVLVLSNLVRHSPLAFSSANPSYAAIQMTYWVSASVFIGALMCLLWALKPSGKPRSK